MVKKLFCYLMPVEVAKGGRVDVGKLLVDVEVHRVGVHSPAGVKEQDRNDLSVLLPDEERKYRCEAEVKGVDPEEFLDKCAVGKLSESGILWPEGETRRDFARDIFREHSGEGLSLLERDVVRLQALSFINGSSFNSTVLPVGKLESIKESCLTGEDGVLDESAFLLRAFELAESLDDFHDSK